jgi:hypothetical protein
VKGQSYVQTIRKGETADVYKKLQTIANDRNEDVMFDHSLSGWQTEATFIKGLRNELYA